MLKVMTIVGTRPEIIRLSRTIPKLDNFCDHTLVHTGQNYDYELNEIFFDELDIRKPDIFLNAAGDTAAETIGKVIIAIDKVFESHKPDAVLILGDTNSALSAIPAKRRKIPIFHMEAGNRCFDFRVPEEINRRIVDHISDINLPYSQIAKQYLIAEGLPPDQIICTGSPMREVIDFYKPKILNSNILKKLDLAVGQYFLVSAHREENVDDAINMRKLIDLLIGLRKTYDLPVVVSTHPRTRKRMCSQGSVNDPLIMFCKPFGFIDYLALQLAAKVVLSDSGTITEESSILNIRALNIRETHERPEGAEEAAVIMTGLDLGPVLRGISFLEMERAGEERVTNLVQDYSATNVSHKIVASILSYTSYVKRKVWSQPT
jgi:UDP-N-acetylglucosamine 2-epimerase (non-hydrolysing)